MSRICRLLYAFSRCWLRARRCVILQPQHSHCVYVTKCWRFENIDCLSQLMVGMRAKTSRAIIERLGNGVSVMTPTIDALRFRAAPTARIFGAGIGDVGLFESRPWQTDGCRCSAVTQTRDWRGAKLAAAIRGGGRCRRHRTRSRALGWNGSLRHRMAH